MNEILLRVLKLLDEKGVKGTEFCEGTGIKQSTFATWKQKERDPQTEYLVKIAQFLNVSLDFLLTGKEKENKSMFFTEDEIALIMSYRTLNPDMKKFVFNAVANNAAPIQQSKKALEWSEKEEDKADEHIRKYEQQVLRAQSELAK